MKSMTTISSNNIVLAIISEMTTIPADSICEQDSLIELGIDSLMTVDLLIAIEEKLRITFDESDLDPETLSTVEAVLNLVVKYEEKQHA